MCLFDADMTLKCHIFQLEILLANFQNSFDKRMTRMRKFIVSTKPCNWYNFFETRQIKDERVLFSQIYVTTLANIKLSFATADKHEYKNINSKLSNETQTTIWLIHLYKTDSKPKLCPVKLEYASHWQCFFLYLNNFKQKNELAEHIYVIEWQFLNTFY